MGSAKAIRSIFALAGLLAVLWVHDDMSHSESLTLVQAIAALEQGRNP